MSQWPAGCSAVKFQKRTVDVVYTAAELAQPAREPLRHDQRRFEARASSSARISTREIDAYCKDKGIVWFASPWDEASVDFLEQFDVPCHKVASASLTDDNLLRHMRATKNRSSCRPA